MLVCGCALSLQGVFTGALSRAAILTEGIDRRARAFLLDGLDKFVAAFLCLMLLVGTLAAVIFFSIQVLHRPATPSFASSIRDGFPACTPTGAVPRSLFSQASSGLFSAASAPLKALGPFAPCQTGQEMHGAVKAAMSVEVGIGSVTQDGIKSYVPEWALEKV